MALPTELRNVVRINELSNNLGKSAPTDLQGVLRAAPKFFTLHCAFVVVAVVAAIATAGTVCAADLMIEYRNGRWQPIPPDEIYRRPTWRQVPRTHAIPEHHFSNSAEPTPIMPAPAWLASKPVVKPQERPAATPAPAPANPQSLQPVYKRPEAPAAAYASHGAPAAGESPESLPGAILAFLWPAIQYAFWSLVGLIVLINLRDILRFIDSVFEAAPDAQPTAQPGQDLQTEAVAAAMTLDLRDLVQSEFSAADIRKQTEVLRTLKDKLDAELKSARATIRRERAKAQYPQSRKETA
jgi:hypothetical protein